MMLFVAGVLAGFAGGLLGIGGGVVLMPVLRFVMDLSPAEAAGTCIVAVFFTTVGGGIRHYCLGQVPMHYLWPVIVAGVMATFVFSILFRHFAQRGCWIDIGIGCIMLVLAIYMILDGIRRRSEEFECAMPKGGGCARSFARKAGLGFAAGVLPGLFGIGTGTLLVPGFSYLLKWPVKLAMGSALVCFGANAFISAAMKYAQGYTLLRLALPMGFGCLAGSLLGATTNHRTPSPVLRGLFGAFFGCIAFRFIASGVWGI